jgi:hypothetical protein
MSRTRSLLLCGTAALTLAAASPDPARAASRVDVTLSAARVDMIEKDRVVASFEASGAIRGLFTVTIDRGADGALGGEWVLVSRYLIDVTPDGQPDPMAADERAALPGWQLHARHKEYFAIVERGTLRGAVAGGSLSYDVDGRLRSIDSLQLTITGGNREFAGLSGSGSLTGSGLQAENGVGALSLAPQGATAAAEVSR